MSGAHIVSLEWIEIGQDASTEVEETPFAQTAMADDVSELSLLNDIMTVMEHGIVVWSPKGICEFHNARIFDVLGLEPDEFAVGTARDDFFARAKQRGEITDQIIRDVQRAAKSHQVYEYDLRLLSGRVIHTHARPMEGGGYVASYTDVTQARAAAVELAKAKNTAERAEARAKEVLATERARQGEARLLSQLDEWLQSCKSLGELYMIVERFMNRLLPGSEGELYIFSNSRDVLEGVCSWPGDQLHPHILTDGCWALRRGRSYDYEAGGLCFPCEHVTDHAHGHAHDHPHDHADADLCSYICVPVIAHGDTVGLLHIRFADDEMAQQDIADQSGFAVRCAEHISLAIANVRMRDQLHERSIRDPLTGLFNRRYFMDAMRDQVALSRRTGATFGLISFDADRFKLFNDRHGHDAGDAVLRALGGQLDELMTGDEVCCRIGGEEFAVLLPHADMDKAAQVAEQLRQAVAETQVRYVDGTLPRVTISAGVAAFPDSGTMPQTLLKEADKALYRAKDAGRNRVMRAEPEPPVLT